MHDMGKLFEDRAWLANISAITITNEWIVRMNYYSTTDNNETSCHRSTGREYIQDLEIFVWVSHVCLITQW